MTVIPPVSMETVITGAVSASSQASSALSSSAETVANITDYHSRTSSREAYVSPTRGAQGNALKTILAMPAALNDGDGTSQSKAGASLTPSHSRLTASGKSLGLS